MSKLHVEPLKPQEEIDDLGTVTSDDRVPSVDQENPVGTYRDWRREDTQVITYRVNNDFYKGIYAETRDDAIAHCKEKFGPILEANYVQGRAFFRIRKLGL